MNVSASSLDAPSMRVGTGTVVRTLVGALLVVAALAKGLSPADSAASVADGWSFPLRLLLVEAELAFGILLILGIWRGLIHYAAIALFVVFAVVALRSVLSGEESCGCFGAITVDPRWTLLIDLAAVVALAATRPAWDELCAIRYSRSVLGAYAAAIIGVPLAYAMANVTPDRGLEVYSAGKFVLLEPETWVGKKLPLLGVLDGASSLSSGEWTLLMHHHGCPDCERVRPSYESRLAQGERVLLVETPPYPESSPADDDKQGHARLPSDREWFVQTPVEIVVEDGVVVAVSRELLPGEETKL